MGKEIHDSPLDWVAKHIDDFVKTGGRVRKGAQPRLLLITRGRRTGKLRRTALNYWMDGDDYLIVGSNGGAAEHPQWYLNLKAEPEVTVQIGTETMPVTARDAIPEERPRLWSMVVADMSSYESFRRKTPRQIPLTLLHPR
jgi:deazaflavin-dependent oxidoreductase (nitroreductase family)